MDLLTSTGRCIVAALDAQNEMANHFFGQPRSPSSVSLDCQISKKILLPRSTSCTLCSVCGAHWCLPMVLR